jgi:uncharacterized protein YcfJ
MKTCPTSLRPARISGCIVLAAAGLSACATPPAGPTLVAVPHSGETYPSFRQHDDYCRAVAAHDVGQSPGDAAQSHAVGGAVAGTAVGAAAGALIGSASHAAGPGAAIGAATGLLVGSAIGSDSGARTAAGLQYRYNTVYAQCMTSYGYHIRAPYPPRPIYVYRGYPPPPPPPPGVWVAPY